MNNRRVKMKYLYSIAGINVLCEIPFFVNECEELKDFFYPVHDRDVVKADMTMQFCMVNAFSTFNKDKCFCKACRYFQIGSAERKIYYCASPENDPHACVTLKGKNPHHILCEYIEGKEKYLNYSRNILECFGIENLLWIFGGFLLHSSLISIKEKGILFSGPSGIGKSTQARLWEQYENAEILNGDRAAIRHIRDKWIAYGSPCAGTSRIYRNEYTEIRAIVILRKATENRIRKVSLPEAFVCLYPEVTVHSWDKEFVEDVSENLRKLLMNIPVYMLECMPEENAVILLKNTILQQNDS